MKKNRKTPSNVSNVRSNACTAGCSVPSSSCGSPFQTSCEAAKQNKYKE
ncbi:hypothetical protein [Cohnella fermenti]|nr:hypothetical protein [Cohnella fermenti]